jgi:hypothetical protein
MRAMRLVSALATVFLLVGLSAVTASAAPPSEVVFELHPTTFFPVELGPWDSSGAVDDGGLFERTEARSSPRGRPFGEPGPFKEVFVLAGLEGTLTIKVESRDTGQTITGVWQIQSGTGAYERASGHGTVAFSFTPGAALPFTLTLSGVASKVDVTT